MYFLFMIQVQANKSRINIGTSGYSYPDWKGVFYPDKTPANKLLPYYCQHFSTVEINGTYYRVMPPKSFELMARLTPDNFEFIVKTHQETTHRRIENELILPQLLESLKPLMNARKLHGLLAQFPHSFANCEANRRYLAQVRQMIPAEITLFVEFRHNSWVKDAIHKFLTEQGIAYVNVDEPALQGLIPPQDWVTGQSGYIRMHGRNQKLWWTGSGSQRYDYEYTPNELREWLTQIGNILKKTYKTYIFFNNHPRGQAVRNAQQMLEIIASREGVAS